MSKHRWLLARHIRLHRDLVGLWRLTCQAPLGAAPGEWERWVERREGLLALLVAHDSPALAAETSAACDAAPDHPLAPRLAQLHEGEVRMMDRILRLEKQLLAAGETQLRLMERELCGAARGRGAAQAYARRG